MASGPYKVGVGLGSAVGYLTKFVLTVLGAAGVWGFSEASGLRDSSDPETNADWAKTTSLMATFTGVYFLNEEYRSTKDESLMEKLRKESQDSEDNQSIGNNFCSFLTGMSSGISKPTAALCNAMDSTYLTERKAAKAGYGSINAQS